MPKNTFVQYTICSTKHNKSLECVDGSVWGCKKSSGMDKQLKQLASLCAAPAGVVAIGQRDVLPQLFLQRLLAMREIVETPHVEGFPLRAGKCPWCCLWHL